MRFRPYETLVIAAALLVVGLASHAQVVGNAPFGKIVIKANAAELDMNDSGVMTWSKGVTITTGEMTVTCDRLKAWRAKNRQDFDRLEAEGDVRISGTYTAPDKTKWIVKGLARSAGFDRKTGIGALRGAVNLEAVNVTTGRPVKIQAEKVTYDQRSQKLLFERGEQQTQMEFEEPRPAAPEVKK